MKGNRYWLLALGSWLLGVQLSGQTIADELRADAQRAAGLSYSLPITELPADTPPAGKKLFYINHYGCPSAYYVERRENYDDPFRTLARADSLGKLTPLGSDVLRRVAQLRYEARDKRGELTEIGKRQSREFARHIMQRYPELIAENVYFDGRSVVENHCILTLGESSLQLIQMHPSCIGDVDASNRSSSWMNARDEELENRRTDSLSMLRYSEFATRWPTDDKRLMAQLFSDADYAACVDAAALSRQLFGLKIYDVFTPEDIHRHWMHRNAWAYIRYGGYLLNGGHQPYVQRKPLGNLIHQGDNIMKLDYPVIHLRYTHERVVVSLACLLELDGYGVQTSCLDSLETYGWADYRIAPLGGSIIFQHYRTDKNDPDPLVRVLLNGRVSKLPIPTDCAPYYHWGDVKRYYLRKLYLYAKKRNDE